MNREKIRPETPISSSISHRENINITATHMTPISSMVIVFLGLCCAVNVTDIEVPINNNA
jgi:hypothetical protein